MTCKSLEDAMEYIKGYCSKHKYCEQNCRLYNEETDKCFISDDAVPCDWVIDKDGGKND